MVLTTPLNRLVWIVYIDFFTTLLYREVVNIIEEPRLISTPPVRVISAPLHQRLSKQPKITAQTYIRVRTLSVVEIGCTGQLLGALNPIEKGIWQAQNQGRQTQEFLELQLQTLWELLQRQDLGLVDPPDWLEPLFIWLTRIVAVLFIGFVLYWLFRGVRYWALRWQKQVPDTPEIRQQAIEQPLAVQDWLAQAQQAQAQHNYALACRALYMALLVRLDEADWLVRNTAWTDQDYLRRLDALWVLHPRPVDLSHHWRHLFLTHEQSVYGKIPVSAERFQDCQRAYQTLELELNKGPLSEPGGPQ